MLAAALRVVEMVLRVGGAGVEMKREGNPPGGGGRHDKKIFGLVQNPLSWHKKCQEQYFDGLGGQKFVLCPEEV